MTLSIGLEFVLFLVLGLAVFIPLQPNARIVAMVVFTVIMALWMFAGLAGWNPHLMARG